MSVFQNTIFTVFFLIPGFISLAIALSPKGRAIRPSSLATRAFAILAFAILDWLIGWRLFTWLNNGIADLSEQVTSLLLGDPGERRSILKQLLELPQSVWEGVGCLALGTYATGWFWSVLQRSAITGQAILDHALTCEALGWHDWIKFNGSRCIYWLLRACKLLNMFQPMGAGYWLVLERVAEILRKQGPREGRLSDARVYADVVQGDEIGKDGHIGVLYTGTVKHLVCETDGNIVFLLLTQAHRWSYNVSQSRVIVDRTDQEGSAPRGKWKPILESRGFAIEGASIRNISFRVMKRTEVIRLEQKQAPAEDEDAG